MKFHNAAAPRAIRSENFLIQGLSRKKYSTAPVNRAAAIKIRSSPPPAIMA
jgi:hypothetical protein